jgi:hypothetical protein
VAAMVLAAPAAVVPEQVEVEPGVDAPARAEPEAV